MKQFLIKNWVIIVFMGILAFFYFDKSQDSSEKTKIINHIQETHERDKEELDREIDSLISALRGNEERLELIDAREREMQERINKIRYEKVKSIINVPSYTDRKLDSILSNHRHIRSR